MPAIFPTWMTGIVPKHQPSLTSPTVIHYHAATHLPSVSSRFQSTVYVSSPVPFIVLAGLVVLIGLTQQKLKTQQIGQVFLAITHLASSALMGIVLCMPSLGLSGLLARVGDEFIGGGTFLSLAEM